MNRRQLQNPTRAARSLNTLTRAVRRGLFHALAFYVVVGVFIAAANIVNLMQVEKTLE